MEGEMTKHVWALPGKCIESVRKEFENVTQIPIFTSRYKTSRPTLSLAVQNNHSTIYFKIVSCDIGGAGSEK